MIDETTLLPMRGALRDVAGVSEKKMMGGVCFLVNGNMLGGANKGRYMFRVGKEQEAEALSRPGARAMIQGGRKFGGFIWVDQENCDSKAVAGWVAMALNYVGDLPPK